MRDFFQHLLSTDFMPHSYCLRLPGLIELHAVSDALIALSYFLIPVSLVYLVRRRRDLDYPWMFLLFGAFILSCGTTHLLSIWTLWHPVYRLDGLVKAITAIASLLTAVLLLRLTPDAIALPSPAQLRIANEQLRMEIEQRREADQEIRSLNAELRQRVSERDAALAEAATISRTQQQAFADRESNVQFILDLLPAMVCYIDDEGRYHRVNRMYQEWFQKPLDEIQGHTMKEVLGSVYLNSLESYVQAVLRGQPVRFETVVDYPIGLRSVEIAYAPDFDDRGAVRGFAALVTDISERKRLERERQRHVDLLDQALEPLLIWELHGVIQYWNRAAEELYGYSAAEAIGRVSHQLLQTVHQAPTTADFESAIEAEGSWSGELTHTTRDGRKIVVASRHRLVIEPGGRKMVLESNRDITERKRMESDLRHLNETLETKVRERTEQLDEANRELEAFSYSVSHDLRAPLRSVDGFGRILLRDYSGKVLDERGVHYIERMGAATVRMGQLIEDLLNLSHLSRTSLRKEFVNLSGLAEQVWREICAENPARCATISIQPNMYASADLRLLRIVLQNLLGNALKFTSKRADAAVAFGCAGSDGKTIYFIRDNGAGFDMAHADQLFAPFQRLHAVKDFEGAGIGLAIVQRIIHRHGGRIWGEGKPAHGAVFAFTLRESRDE